MYSGIHSCMVFTTPNSPLPCPTPNAAEGTWLQEAAVTAVTFLCIAVVYGLLLGLIIIFALAFLEVWDLCQYADKNEIPNLLLKSLGILFVVVAQVPQTAGARRKTRKHLAAHHGVPGSPPGRRLPLPRAPSQGATPPHGSRRSTVLLHIRVGATHADGVPCNYSCGQLAQLGRQRMLFGGALGS